LAAGGFSTIFFVRYVAGLESAQASILWQVWVIHK